MSDLNKNSSNVEIWYYAVNRQYEFFATAIGFLTTGFAIFGTIISKIDLTSFEKITFSIVSVVMIVCLLALLRMVHIERSVAFKAVSQRLPNVDKNLQDEENRWRKVVEWGLATSVVLILLIVNFIIWR